MSFVKRRRGRRGLVSGLLGAVVLGAILATGFDIDLPLGGRDAGKALATPVSNAACGAAASRAIIGVDEFVAGRIHTGELHGQAVRTDIAHITGSRELLTALASSNQATVYAMVHKIVYTPHWHIVRLRVVQNGRVVADVGGPDVISPISGSLHYQGRTIGHFVMSVQDDLGYVKLVSRFIGIPIDLYRGGSLVMGTLKPAPSSVSDGETVTVGHHSYQARVFNVTAFPTGALKVVLFIPTPASTAAARSCASVRLSAWSNVAIHIAARYKPLWAHYEEFRYTLQGASGGVLLVRSGAKRLVGVGPARVPRRGIVKYRGHRWAVFSWEAHPPARIYFLTPTG